MFAKVRKPPYDIKGTKGTYGGVRGGESPLLDSVRHDMKLEAKAPNEPLTGQNQIAKGNCVTVMWGGRKPEARNREIGGQTARGG